MSVYQQGLAAAESGTIFCTPYLIVYPSIPTTMDVADARIKSGKSPGTTIIALEQTAGRGSGDRPWASNKGNLMFSRTLEMQPGEFGQEMEMIAACAVAETIQELLPNERVNLKYPNDVLVNDAKICGCLVPPIYDVDAKDAPLRQIVLGVGVNLAIAPELPNGKKTTSLAAHGIAMDIPSFMEKFDRVFASIVMAYRREENFDLILRRMGFIDEKGMITLTHNNSDHLITGFYNGFVARKMEDGRHIAELRLRTSTGGQGCWAVHDYYMVNSPKLTGHTAEIVYLFPAQKHG